MLCMHKFQNKSNETFAERNLFGSPNELPTFSDPIIYKDKFPRDTPMRLKPHTFPQKKDQGTAF